MNQKVVMQKPDVNQEIQPTSLLREAPKYVTMLSDFYSFPEKAGHYYFFLLLLFFEGDLSFTLDQFHDYPLTLVLGKFISRK